MLSRAVLKKSVTSFFFALFSLPIFRPYSVLTPASALRYNSWQCLGGHLGSQALYQGCWLHARQMPSLLCHHSRFLLCCFWVTYGGAEWLLPALCPEVALGGVWGATECWSSYLQSPCSRPLPCLSMSLIPFFVLGFGPHQAICWCNSWFGGHLWWYLGYHIVLLLIPGLPHTESAQPSKPYPSSTPPIRF